MARHGKAGEASRGGARYDGAWLGRQGNVSLALVSWDKVRQASRGFIWLGRFRFGSAGGAGSVLVRWDLVRYGRLGDASQREVSRVMVRQAWLVVVCRGPERSVKAGMVCTARLV